MLKEVNTLYICLWFSIKFKLFYLEKVKQGIILLLFTLTQVYVVFLDDSQHGIILNTNT